MVKHLHKLGLLLASFLLMGSSGLAYGQALQEDFSYASGAELVTQTGWALTGTTTTNPIQVSTTGLSYLNLAGSGVGKAVNLVTTGQDVNKVIGTSYTSGALYTSFLVNFSAAQATGDYFFHLGPASMGSTYVPRVFAKSTTGGVLLGASISSTSPVYGTEVLVLNQTYLVVLKHNFVTGSSNDVVELFVNPVLGAAEPTTNYVSATAGTDPANLGTIGLRQGTATSAPTLTLDAIKVGTTWGEVIGTSVADTTPPTFVSGTPANAATNVSTDLDLVLTFSEPVVAGTGTVTISSSTESLIRAANDPETVYNGSTVTVRNLALKPNTTYTVTVANTAFKDAAGNFFAGITGSTWTFTTAAVATPSINASVSSLDFSPTAVNKMSAVKSYTVTGASLTSNVTVAVTGPFQIAKGEGATVGTFGTTALTFTPAEITAGANVSVRFMPTGLVASTGTIIHSSTGAQDVMVNLTGTGINPLVQNFNDPNFLTNSGWTQVNVSGPANSWMYTSTGPNSAPGAAVMNGFSDTNTPSNDWLISPAMDLTSMSDFAVLSFYARKFFAGPGLKLFVSTTYNGSGTINAADWTEIEGDFPTATGTWKQSTGINLTPYKSATTYVAFVYQTTAGGSGNTSEWKIDDYKVESVTTSSLIPTTALTFAETAPNAVSASQSFRFTTLGHGNITITAPAGFQVSADNTTFASSIVVPSATAEAGATVYARFAPTAKQLSYTGALAFAGSVGNFTANGPTVSGSSVLRSETFDIATYNVEFFASDIKDGTGEFGPTNDPLQIENVTKVFQKLNMDIIAVEELSEEPAMDQVLAAMPGYAKSISQVYSYSIKPNSSTTPFPAQKVGFIYNTATVRPVGFRVMFEALYRQAVAGTTTLIDDDFWSSGRLPYMGTFDVTVDGITKRIRVIDIHAKSGSSSTDYNRRLADIRVLKDSLDTYYKDHNVILLGDYNDNVFGSINSGGVSSYNSFVTDVEKYKVLTYQLAQSGAYSFPSSNSFLDHITITNELVDDYMPNSITVEDPNAYINSYATTTSDHLPVYARFAFTANDLLGVREEKVASFRVTPNPTTGAVTLQLPAGVSSQGNLSAVVYNLRGEVVGRSTGSTDVLNKQLTKQLGSAAAGMYLIKVQAGDKTYQARIIKN
ncbi:choice-of-anchor J domain-containing protein [Rufibacter radiotolerans]|uniref:choice-of-anchor J domain-containing protein n=1 Tax=Rufibacter radiotolerans TaxID=1379910 RepID=UPI0009E55E77|nr:Ig-like domain-containing protein [Rufibacter radiotolerans]